MLRAGLFAALLSAGSVSAGSSQGASGVEGRVVDAVGRPLAAAQVVVEREGRAAAGQAETNADGGWRITHLEPGRYRVTARRVGFRAASREALVERGHMLRLSFVLEPVGQTLDSLVVSAPAISISTRDPELGTRLTEREIALLPTTLELRPLIALTPGARPDQIWGGASDQANSYLLDGTLLNHPGTGGFFFLPSPSWLESLAVRGLGTGAEHGNFQGGLVEVTTRSGGARLEGSVRAGFESHRFNTSNLIPGEIGREIGGRWELDAQLRGPLARDRVHFALFGHLIREDSRVLNQLPGGSGDFVPDPPGLADYRWLGKLSWQPGGRDVIALSLLGRVLDGERTAQTGFEAVEATERLRQRSFTGSLAWQRSWSPRSALEVRLSGYAATERREPGAGPAVPGIETLAAVDPAGYQNAPFSTRSEPSSLGVNVTWSLRGRAGWIEHELKLGGEYALGAWDYVQRRNGGLTWRPFATETLDHAVPSTWSAGGAVNSSWGGEVVIDSDVRNGALFLQDDITVASWLRLNPGLRLGWWSGALAPAAGTHFTAVRATALEPRLGVVLDLERPTGFVAKAHWGRYHQSMFAALFDRVEGGGVFNDEELWTYRGPPLRSSRTSFSLAERDALAAEGLFTLTEKVRLAQVGRVENYRQPYVDQTMLALERSFGAHWKAAAVYLRRRNRDMVALVDRNLEQNYTVIDNVLVSDRFGRQLYFEDEPFKLERIALSNEDVIRIWELYKQGVFLGGRTLWLPPDLTPAQLDALRFEPDLVLTTVPEATRKLEQLQLRVEARYRTWWAGASATISSLNGNFNVVTGPDDYTNGGPGPWVRLNEQFNFFGALNNQSEFEAKLHGGGLLPGGFRAGAFFHYFTGDRVAPVLPMSSVLTTYELAMPRRGAPPTDTLPLYSQLFRTTSGQRMFVLPRGSLRYSPRAALDLHLERSFPRGNGEVILAVDAFNVFNDRSVIAIQTAVNTLASFFESDYGRVRGRVPPRTIRLGAAWRF